MRALLLLPLLLALASSPAHARFGKRSTPASTQDATKDATHEATAPGEEPEARTDDAEAEVDDGSGGGWEGVGALLSLFVPRHTEVHLASGDPGPTPLPLAFTLGVEGLALPRDEGGGASLRLAVEGARWGAAFRVLGLGLATDDGSYGRDELALLDAQLTYALLATPRLRLRLEAGLHSAHAPSVSFLAPTVGTSLEACVVGPLDVEGRLQLVPFPDRVLDAQAGLALHLGTFGLHGGWRTLLLDDAGLTDGVRHTDAFSGPYVGASVVF